MTTFLELMLAVVLYGILADGIDRAIEREMRKRQPDGRHLRLVKDFDADEEASPVLHSP